MVAVPASFDIQPVTAADDIAQMAAICVGTGWPDMYVQLRFRDAQHMVDVMAQTIRDTLGKPGWTYLKAVDRQAGVLAAWASYYVPPDEELRRRAGRDSSSSESDQSLPSGDDHCERFGKYVESHRERVRADWLWHRRHMEFASLFTDTPFRGRGMGTALTARAIQAADEKALPLFIQASPKAWQQVYAKKGFNVVSHLDVDCAAWMPPGDTGEVDRGVGFYKIRWMLRLPETLPAAPGAA